MVRKIKDKKIPDVFLPQPSVFEQPAPVAEPTPEPVFKPREPSFPGEVIVPETFSPSAKKILPSGGFRDPRPELGEQVLEDTSPTAQIVKQQEQLLAEETPVRQELDPTAIAGETLPFVGPFISAGLGIGDFVKRKLGIETTQQKNFNPNDYRNAELAAIAKAEIDKGITLNEAFGAYVEALPTGDSVLGVSFAKTLEQPSENAAQVASNIKKIKRELSNVETNVRMGYLPVATAQEQVDAMERNLIGLETRLKSLTNASPTLRFNSDLVNGYETDILVVKEKMLQAKLNIIQGKTQDPNEMELLLKIKELDGGETEDE